MNKILIVNDKADERKTLAAIVSDCCEVMEAPGLQPAEKILAQNSGEIGAVIVSADLPENGGLELLAELCFCESEPEIPVILDLDSTDEDTIKRADAIGAYDFIFRPYSALSITLSVRRALGRYESQTKLAKAHRDIALKNLLLNNSDSAVYVCNAGSYKLQYVSEKCAKMCGRSVQSAAGQTCYEYLTGEKAPCRHCLMQESGSEEYVELKRRDESTGKSFQCKTRFIDLEGSRSFINYFKDISEYQAGLKRIEALADCVPTGIGLVDIYPDGKVKVTYLNDSYYSGIDTTKSARARYSDYAFHNAIHPDDDFRLTSDLLSAAASGDAIGTDFRVFTESGGYKWLHSEVKRIYKTDEKAVLCAVITNIDDEKRAALTLQISQQILELANTQGRISVWLYDIAKKRATVDTLFSPNLGLPEVMDNIPESAVASGLVMNEDKDIFIDAYNKIDAGADRSECDVRMYNLQSNAYEWQHMVITRIRDSYLDSDVAFCVSADVDSQHNTRIHYEHELQLRTSLLKDAVVYFEVNLTANTIEEYQTKFASPEQLPKKGTPCDIVFSHFLSLVAEEDLPMVSERLSVDSLRKAYSRGERFRECTYRHKSRDGNLHWVKASVSLVTNPDMDEALAFFFIMDIDNEIRNRQALDTILSEEIETAFLVDVKTGMTQILCDENELWGIQKGKAQRIEALAVRHFCARAVREDLAACNRFFNPYSMAEALEISSPTTLTYRVRELDGTISRKRANAFFLDERHSSIVITRRDITQLYEEEQRQKQLLQQAVDAANSANKAKSDFLSRMSHDMRTPLNAVIGLTALSEKEDNPPKTRDYLRQIDDSGHYLLSLINDLLDMDRIESGKITLEDGRYTLEEFGASVNTVIRPLMDKKHISFDISLDCGALPFRTDKMRYCQIFFNLLSNASKYTAPGGHVELRAELLPEDELGRQGLRFLVKDNGKGMSEEFLSKAFEPFTQESGSNVETAGSGLGLAIVKRLVDIFGGTIEVASRLGEGTQYTIDLYSYVDTSSPQNEAFAEEDYSRLGGMHILVVDDQAINILVVKGLLESEGCIVDSAESGSESIEKFSASAPGFYSAILMDVRMPGGMNGLEATAHIRSLDRSDALTIPIIALTGDAIREDRENQLRAGMNVSLSKPVEPKLLFETLLQQTK